MDRFTKRRMEKRKHMYKKAGMVLPVVAVFLIIVGVFLLQKERPGYYQVILNGEKLGKVKGESTAYSCMSNTRLKLNEEKNGLVYMNPQLEIYKEKASGDILSNTQLEQKMYDVLQATEDMDSIHGFVINIEGYTLNLRSREDILQVLNEVKATYDTENVYEIEIVESENSEFEALTANIIKRDTAEAKADSSLLSLEFGNDIEIMETYAGKEDFLTVEQAVQALTELVDTREIYVIEPLDTLYWIAMHFDTTIDELLELNEYLDVDSDIYIGDEIVVNVPQPHLAILSTVREEVTEVYEADVQYVDNDKMYTNEEKVIQKGKKGRHHIVANVNYRNGRRESKEIQSEDVIKEAVPEIIERGTIDPPTYVKPVSLGVFTSGFGARWGTVHKGIDWACSIGTSIYASCGGTVISAGWRGTYGYCVEIEHADGNRTRYAHLSEVLVSAGDVVKQYDKIALSGNTGDSTGPHVHFEILVNGVQIDPFTYLE